MIYRERIMRVTEIDDESFTVKWFLYRTPRKLKKHLKSKENRRLLSFS